MVLIVLVGLVPFALGVSGVAYERATRLVSITITTTVLAIVCGARAAATRFGGYRHLLPIAVMLALAMYGFIIAAILVEGLGGIHGYFHAPGRGLAPGGMSVGTHIGGQLGAMLFSIGLFWLLAAVGFALSRYLYFPPLRASHLVAVAVARVVPGAAGVRYAIGTWVTSLTLAAMVLALCYGYRARARGFTRLGDVALLAPFTAARVPRRSARRGYFSGNNRTITTPWGRTSAENSPSKTPRSFCRRRSRTRHRPWIFRSAHRNVTLADLVLRERRKLRSSRSTPCYSLIRLFQRPQAVWAAHRPRQPALNEGWQVSGPGDVEEEHR
jgi:hypothetical protein